MITLLILLAAAAIGFDLFRTWKAVKVNLANKAAPVTYYATWAQVVLFAFLVLAFLARIL